LPLRSVQPRQNLHLFKTFLSAVKRSDNSWKRGG